MGRLTKQFVVWALAALLCAGCVLNVGSRQNQANGNGFGGSDQATAKVADALARLRKASPRLARGEGLRDLCNNLKCGAGDEACDLLKDLHGDPLHAAQLKTDLIEGGELASTLSHLDGARFEVVTDPSLTAGADFALRAGKYLWQAAPLTNKVSDDVAMEWLQQLSGSASARQEAACLVPPLLAVEGALPMPASDLFDLLLPDPPLGNFTYQDSHLASYSGYRPATGDETVNYAALAAYGDGVFEAEADFNGTAGDVWLLTGGSDYYGYLDVRRNGATLSYSYSTRKQAPPVTLYSGTITVDPSAPVHVALKVIVSGAGVRASLNGSALPPLFLQPFSVGGPVVGLLSAHGERIAISNLEAP